MDAGVLKMGVRLGTGAVRTCSDVKQLEVAGVHVSAGEGSCLQCRLLFLKVRYLLHDEESVNSDVCDSGGSLLSYRLEYKVIGRTVEATSFMAHIPNRAPYSKPTC